MEKNLYLKPEISVLLLQTENVLGAPNESPQTIYEKGFDDSTYPEEVEELY